MCKLNRMIIVRLRNVAYIKALKDKKIQILCQLTGMLTLSKKTEEYAYYSSSHNSQIRRSPLSLVLKSPFYHSRYIVQLEFMLKL